MATPPSLKRVNREEFSGIDASVLKGVDKLLYVLNPFLGSVTDALSKRLTFGENFAAVVKDVEVTMPAEWVPINLLNGVTQWDPATSGTVSCRKIDGMIETSGLAKHNGTGGVATIGALPAGYAPAFNVSRMATSVNNSWAMLGVNAGTGNIVLLAGGSLSANSQIGLNNLRFRAADPNPVVSAPFPLDVGLDGLPGKPGACVVLRALDVTDKTPRPVLAPSVAWEPGTTSTKQSIRISALGGLQGSRKYKLTLLVTV